MIMLIVSAKINNIASPYKTLPLLPGIANPYEVACLQNGQRGLLSLLILQLINKGYLLHDTKHPKKLIQNPAYPAPDLTTEEKIIWHCFSEPTEIEAIVDKILPFFNQCITSLQQKKLVVSDKKTLQMLSFANKGIITGLSLGLYKLLIALSKGYPNISYLCFMMVGVWFFSILIYRKNIIAHEGKKFYFKTKAGILYLKKLQKTLEKAKVKIKNGVITMRHEQMFLFSIALFGISILPAAANIQALKSFYPNNLSVDGSSGGGCSGDGGCGGGCGGCS